MVACVVDSLCSERNNKVVTAELKKMKTKHFTSKLTFALRILQDRNDIDVKSSGRKCKPAKDRKLVIYLKNIFE
jgi:hypothetical protein